MKNIPKIIPVMYAKALKDGTLVWGEDCVSATNDFEEDGFTGVALVRLSDVDACQTNEQGRDAEGAVSVEQVNAAYSTLSPIIHIDYKPALVNFTVRKALEQFAATQPPSASPVAVPEGSVAMFMGMRKTPVGTREFWGYMMGSRDLKEGTPLYATPPALPDAGLDSQKGGV